MKVGDYVRTKNEKFQPSQIAKISKIEKDMVYKGQKCLNLDHNLLTTYEFLIYEEDVIKSSPNLIDLIFKDDFVNGHLVICKMYENEKDIPTIVKCVGEYYFKEEDIKSIVTKEMYSSVEYRIGE